MTDSVSSVSSRPTSLGSKARRPGGLPRRPRAPVACLLCRSRRVRCDVSESGVANGGRCSNCRFYGKECVVKDKKGPLAYTSVLPSILLGRKVRAGPDQAPTASATQDIPTHSAAQRPKMPVQDSPAAPNNVESHVSPGSEARYLDDTPTADDVVTNVPNITETPNADREGLISLQTFTVPFSDHSFLILNGLSHKSADEIGYLETRQCLQVPSRAILEKFFEAYFLHIHPHLPFLNEGEFWDMLSNESNSPSPNNIENHKLSLFVLQAMLFAASPFVSMETINLLGFSSTRQGREQYWDRAKLLFDVETELDDSSIAQGALLLAYHTAYRSILKTNTFWLETAIRASINIDAHIYYNRANHSSGERNKLKRLWWCCILRDRILPLGVRRSLRVRLDHFEFHNFPMTIGDFEMEFDSSKVYDSVTKRQHAEIFVTQCGLAVALTDTIATLYPMQQTPASCLAKVNENPRFLRAVEDCKTQLLRWYKNAKGQLHPVAAYGSVQGSVAVGTAMVFIYFYSALVALCQFERLLLEVIPLDNVLQDNNRLEECIWQFQNAIDGVTKHANEIVRLELAKFLPVSIAAYTALPLILHLLDVKLAPGHTVGALKQRRLGIFLELMKVYEPRFAEIENLWVTIRLALDFLAIESPSLGSSIPRRILGGPAYRGTGLLSPSSNQLSQHLPKTLVSSANVPPARDWREVFATHPYQFMPIALLLDLSISQNKVPNRGDIFVRLPDNSALARLLPSPSCGPRINNSTHIQQIASCHDQRIQEEASSQAPQSETRNNTTSENGPLDTDEYEDSFLLSLPSTPILDFMEP